MCSASSQAKTEAKNANAFASQLQAQATSVFGNDDKIFNEIHSANEAIVNGGPTQHGFSQAELNARNSAAITNNANQFRMVAGAVKSGQAGFGGGNTVSGAGVTTGQNLQVAQAAAAHTASDLNSVVQEDYATGRDNFFKAESADREAAGVYNNLPGMDEAALKGAKQANEFQSNVDTQNGWWKGPVMSLVNTGLSMATGGLSNLASGKSWGGGASGGGGGSTSTAGA